MSGVTDELVVGPVRSRSCYCLAALPSTSSDRHHFVTVNDAVALWLKLPLTPVTVRE